MTLPRKKIIADSHFQKELEILIKYADKALKEWRPIWTPFLPAPLIEEFKNKFYDLNDITYSLAGGFPSSERKRICFVRAENLNHHNHLDIPLKGIYIKGNFLFDRATTNDFKKIMHDFDAQAQDIGDIWLIRDRGAQAICSQECADFLDQRTGRIREVQIKIEKLDINNLEIPFTRVEKVISTVEASTRLDAIASAGFGLSRSKITTQIKKGFLRLNWTTSHQPSKSVNVGDIVHLEKKGSLKILTIDKTKKERWRIKLLRQ